MIQYKDRLATAVFSDVLDDMGYRNQMLPMTIKPNIPEAKICGRARTLQLKALEQGEDPRGIYRSLGLVQRLEAGEVLVVGGGFETYAFFGELMSTLAQQRGAAGVIVDGCTRDYAETVRLAFPVFARGTYARDVKGRATVKEMDMAVVVGDVTIVPGQLLFGDYDGVIAIPAEVEEQVLQRALEVVTLEDKIKNDLKSGRQVEDILKQCGDF